jgi:16S rRNA C1402 (ribose-2'-O) methylase RsmI
MMMYVLIVLSLSLVGVAGLQFFYLAYLERIERERKIRLVELEHKCRYLTARLKDAERRIAEQNELIDAIYDEDEIEDDEVWADVIEDR